MGIYYLSAVTPPDEGSGLLEKAVALSKNASEGERRFIAAMAALRANHCASFMNDIPLLEKLASDYPDERLVFTLLGQLYQGANESDKARAAFERAPTYPEAKRKLAMLRNGAGEKLAVRLL